MTPTTFIKQNYDALITALVELKQTLHQDTPSLAYVASLPPVTKQDENALNPEHNPNLTIEPKQFYEDRALRMACESFLDLHVIPGLSQRIARRRPGVLWINPQTNPLANVVERLCQDINTAKSNIRNCVTGTYSTSAQRFDLLKDALPATFTVHLYRHIRCFNDRPIQAVRFNWIRQQALLRADKAELIESIAESMEHANDTNTLISFETLLKAVVSTPAGNIRMRRSQPVQPVANIRTCDAASYTPHPAAMPMIIIQNTVPTIKPLPDYDHQQRKTRKPRSDRRENLFLGHFLGHTIEAVP